MGRKVTGHLFLRGGVWQVRTRVNGRETVRSTGKTDRDEAARVVKEMLSAFELSDRADTARLLAAQAVEMDAKAGEAGKTPAPAIGDAWTAYLASPLRNDPGARTLAGYQMQWRRFAEWAIGDGFRRVDEIGEPAAARYAETMHGFSGGTYNKHVTFLAAMWRALRLPADVWGGIRLLRVVAHSRRELTAAEFRRVLDSAAGELRVLLTVGAYTGLRLGDACTLRWDEVDIDGGMIVRVPRKTSRSGRPVRVPIHPDLAACLGKGGAGFVVPEMARLYSRGAPNVTQRIQRHFAACGIVTTSKAPSKRAVVDVGFHSLRHTFVSMCRGAGVPLSVVEAIVGHSGPAMTRHYTHVGDDAAAAAVATLPGLVSKVEKREALPAWAREMLEKATARTWRKVIAQVLREK